MSKNGTTIKEPKMKKNDAWVSINYLNEKRSSSLFQNCKLNFKNHEYLGLAVLGLQQISSSTENIFNYRKYKDKIRLGQANQLTKKMRDEVSR